jgi:predicted Zn-dependent peptidase
MSNTSPNVVCVSGVLGRAREAAARIFPFLFLVACSCQCVAAEPGVDYVHSYRSVVFANGLTAILTPRQETRSVSIRVLVDVGQLDFDCENRELPHLAEHLMFSGTSTHTESELDDLIDSLGGSWNAGTNAWTTTYELDIHHDYVYEGLAVLHAMFTDTQLTDEKVQIARDVVDREAGGAPGPVEQYLYRNGIMLGSTDKAYREFLPESRAFCVLLSSTEHLAREDVEQFLTEHYVPANFTLIVVGAFDPERMTRAIEDSFGAAAPIPPATKTRPTIDPLPRKVDFSTTLDPILDSSTYVSLEFAIPHLFSTEKTALELVATYLSQQLFDTLRTRQGLAYSPSAQVSDFGDASTLELSATVDVAKVDEATTVMRTLVEDVIRQGIPSEDFQRIKQSSVLTLDSGYETNADIASFYEQHIRFFREQGAFPDLEAIVESLDEDLVLLVARQYLTFQRAMWYEAAPTLTFSQLWLVAAIPLLTIGALLLFRRRRRRVAVDGAQSGSAKT